MAPALPLAALAAALALVAAAAWLLPGAYAQADTVPPGVDSVTSPLPNGTYGAANLVIVTVNFNETVVVGGSGEPPSLLLRLDGGANRTAVYSSGNGTVSLNFTYAVQHGDISAALDYAPGGALAAGAGIRDAAGNAADLALPEPGDSGSLSDSAAIRLWAVPSLVPLGTAAVQGASSVVALEAGGKQYILAGGSTYVNLTRVHENGTLEAADSLEDGGDVTLRQIDGIDAFRMGNETWAVAAAKSDNAIQTIRVHDNGTLEGVDSLSAGPQFGAPWDVKAFEMGAENHTYALAVSSSPPNVQLARVHPNGTLEPAGNLHGTVNNFQYPIRSDVFRLENGSVRALVTAYSSHRVHLFSVNETGLAYIATAADDSQPDGAFPVLAGPAPVVSFDLGGERHALVGSYSRGDEGLQLIRIADGGDSLEEAGSARNGTRGFDALDNARSISVFSVGNATYAAAIARDDNGIQLVRVGAGVGDGALLPAGSAKDATNDPGSPFTSLVYPHGIDTFELGGRMYAAVAAQTSNAVQLVRLFPTSVTLVNSTTDRVHGAGSLIDVTVNFDGNVSWSTDHPPPSLALDTGGAPAEASYVSGNGTSALRFAYTVRAGDATDDLDYSGAGALSGYLYGADGLPASLELPAPGSPGSLSDTSDILVDPAAPPMIYADSVNTGERGFDNTRNSLYVDALTAGNRTYVAVPTQGAELTLARVHENGTLSLAGQIAAGEGGIPNTTYFHGAAVLYVDGNVHVLVSSCLLDTMFLIRSGEDGTLSLADSLYDGDNPEYEFDCTSSIDAFEMGGDTHAIVTGFQDRGAQLVRIHGNGTLEARGSVDGILHGPIAVDVFEMGGQMYAVAAAYYAHGVQLIRIHEDGTLEAGDSLLDSSDPELKLGQAHGVRAFTLGERAYALVASDSEDAVQLIRIHEDGTLEKAGSANDGDDGFMLDGARFISVFGAGNGTYALVASYYDDAVQMIRVRDGDAALLPAGSAARAGGFDGIDNPFGVDSFPLGGGTYAISQSHAHAGGLQLIRMSPALPARVTPGFDGAYGAGSEIEIAVQFDDTVLAEGPLELRLGTGNAAEYRRGNGTDTLVFNYTVQRGEYEDDLEYAGTGALSGGGTITDAATGLPAARALPPPGSGRSLGDTADVALDGGVPLVVSVGTAAANRTYSVGESIEITVTFARAVVAAGPLEIRLNSGGAAVYREGSGTDTLVFSYTVRDGEEVADLEYAARANTVSGAGTITEAGTGLAVGRALPIPGSGGSLGDQSDIVVDARGPAVASASIVLDDGVRGVGSVVNVNMTFDQTVVYSGDPPTLALDVGGEARAATYAEGNGTKSLVFNYTVRAGDYEDDLDYLGTGALSGNVTDIFGNPARALPRPGSLSASHDVLLDHAAPRLLAAAYTSDGQTGHNAGTTHYDALAWATDADAIAANGSTFAVVSAREGAVQLIRVHDDGTMEAEYSVHDPSDSILDNNAPADTRSVDVDGLASPFGVEAFYLGGAAHAIVSSLGDGGDIRMLRINGSSGTLSPGSLLKDNSTLELGGATKARVFEMGGSLHALVAGFSDNGVQLVNITAGGGLVPADSLDDTEAADLELTNPYDLDVFDLGEGEKHALVSGHNDDGVQLVRIHGDGTLEAADQLPDNSTLALRNPRGVAAFDLGEGEKHALVASQTDSGIQLLRVHDGGTLEPVASETDGADGFEELLGAFDIAELGGSPGGVYAAVASTFDHGVQLVRVRADGAMLPAGSVTDGDPGFEELLGAHGIAAFGSGGGSYVLVASIDDHGIQLIRTSTASVANVTTGADGGPHMPGSAINISVAFDGGVTVAGPLELKLNTGGVARHVPGGAGSGSGALVFRYVVSDGDRDAAVLEYDGVHALRAGPGGSITEDSTGLPANALLPPPGSQGSLGGSSRVAVGIPPSVVSVSSPNASATYGIGDAIHINVTFDEPVRVTGTPRIALDAGAEARYAEYAAGSGSASLAFLYTVVEGDMAPDLDYAGASALSLNGGTIEDLAGNAAILKLPYSGGAGSLAGTSDLRVDGTRQPDATAAATAAFTGPNTVRISYSAPLDAPEGHSGPVYGAVTTAGGAAADPEAGGVSGLGTAVHTVRFGGDGVAADEAGTIALNTDLEGEEDGILYVFTDDTIEVGPGTLARTATPIGQAPVVAIVPGSFVRTVNVVDGGDSVRPAINVTGLAEGGAPGSAGRAATFPVDAAVSIVASFAEVSFPPGVTASPVPADGLLELRVSDMRPTAGRVAAALGVSEVNLDVRKVVEVGDSETRIGFDMPVRILLDGQAGGTAFWIDGAAAVVPISTECAADDTAAVHAQLGGAGECQIDIGGDKAVYTYHLTLFGTARTSSALEIMVAGADAGGTVRVPAGTYAADVLLVDKPLTIEPADPDNPPLFTGYSHIVVRPPAGGPVAIRGLVFEDTAHTSGGDGLASIVVESKRGDPAAGGPVTIEGNAFRNTCDSAVRAAADAGAPPIAGLVIRGNAFHDIGGNRAACASSPNAPDRADAIVAGRHGPFTAETAQLVDMAVLDNHIFSTTYTGMRIAGADGLVVEGNHIEDVPDDGIRILPSRNVEVRGNTIVGANSAPHMPGAHDGAAGAAIEVWSGSDDVAATLNRISESAGAFSVCAGTCDPGADAADGTVGLPVPVSRVPVGPGDMRFNHNVLAGSNEGVLVANNAGGALDARANYYPGYAASAGGRTAPAGGAVLHEPALDAAGPVRIGAVVADGAGSSVRSLDAAVRAAFKLGVLDFNARQAAAGGTTGLEYEVAAVPSPDSTAAARAAHASAAAGLLSGASADGRMLPVLHRAVSSAMSSYDGSGAAALAEISNMSSTRGHYPFVLDRAGVIVAHGADPSLVGDTGTVRTLAGGTDAALAELLDFSAAGTAAGVEPGRPDTPWKWWAYEFADPSAGGTASSKRSVIALHPGPDGALHNADDLVFGAGYYPGPGAAHLVAAAGDAPAAALGALAAASSSASVVAPYSTASQLALPDAMIRLAPPDSKLARVVLEQAAADRTGAAPVAVAVLNDSASLQSMGLAAEIDRMRAGGSLPAGVSAAEIITYDSSAARAGWAADAAGRIAAAVEPQGPAAAVVYAGRAGAFAGLAEAFGAQPPSGARWYATGEMSRADLAAAGPAAAALARAAGLVVLSQHAEPNATIDDALALRGTGIAAVDESVRGPAYAAFDAPGLLGRAIASAPGSVAAAIAEGVARTHDGALGSPLILDSNGDLILPITYAVSRFPAAAGGAWEQLPNRIGERTCGIALASGAIDFDPLAAGERTGAAAEAVVNTGTLPYRSVTLEPSGWKYDGTGPDALPASITELRELDEEDRPVAEFEDIGAGTEVALGLGPGTERGIEYRVDLSGHSNATAGRLSQDIAYTVECDASR